jgi:hypothetical protein
MSPNKIIDHLVIITTIPILSTILYCKITDRLLIHHWYHPSYFLWMSFTYTSLAMVYIK